MFPAPPEPPYDAGAFSAMAGRLDFGDVLSTSARVAAANFITFASICAICILPSLLLQTFFSMELEDWQRGFSERALQGVNDPDNPFAAFGDVPWGAFVGIFGSWILFFVLFLVAQGSLVFTTVEHMAGRKAQLGEALAKGISHSPSVLLVGVLVLLMSMATMIPTMIVLVTGSALMGPAGVLICMCPGYVFSILLGLYVYSLFAMAVPAAVVEPGGPIRALGRALELGTGQRFTIFLTILVFMIVVFVAMCGVGCVSLTAAAAGGGLDPATGMMKDTPLFARVLGFVFSFVWELFFSIGNAALVAVMYARLVGIRDGVDADKLAEVFA